MEEKDILILRSILRKKITTNYKENLTTGDWQFNEDGTIQVYAGDIKIWYYLNKSLIFDANYNEDNLFNINSL